MGGKGGVEVEFEQIYTEKKRNALIRSEKKKLKIILENMDEKTRSTCERLTDEAAFMAATLEELRKIISRDGPVETYQNGENQKGLKKSAAVEAYDKMVNTYTKVTRQLVDMLPKTIKLCDENGGVSIREVDDDSAEALMAYVNSFKR